MKAVVFRDFGGPETLEITDVPDPAPGEGDVLIDIAYASINPVDWKIRDGKIAGLMPHEFPVIPGWDGAGLVAATGTGVDRVRTGDRVFFYSRRDVVHDGTYAERISLPQSFVARTPRTLDDAAAASVPLTALTAWQALHEFAGVQAGETVLVTGGAGGVGSFAVQLAKRAGATVLATASARNHDYLISLGVDHPIDYNTESVPEAVRRLAPQGCDVVFDCVGGDAYTEGVRVLKPGGRIASIVVVPDEAQAQSEGYKAGFVFVRPEGQQLETIGAFIDEGKLQIPSLDVRSVRDAAAVQEENKLGHTRGKIVLKIDF